VRHDVNEAAHLALKVPQLIAVGIEIDHSYGFSGVRGDNKGIHVITM
jgi:hypothetical protein